MRPSWLTTAVVNVWVTIPDSGAVVDAEEACEIADLRRAPGRERPLVERVGSRQHRLAIRPEYRRRIERRVERHAENGEAVPDPGFIRAAPDALEVLDDQRTEVGQRTPRIDEGDDQDPSGEILQRAVAAVLILQ